MSVRPTWIPARSITIEVASYNRGGARRVSVVGPSGVAATAPTDPDDWQGMISWVVDVVAGEMGVALGQLRDETDGRNREEA